MAWYIYFANQINYIPFQDVNHSTKKFYGQLVTGAEVTTMGMCVVDPSLILVGGAPLKVVQRKDFASDSVILAGTSPAVVKGILSLGEEKIGDHTITAIVLLSVRLIIVGWNSKVLFWSTRVEFLWFGWLMLSHLSGVSKATMLNLFNTVLSGAFAAAWKQIDKLWRCSEEVQ